MTDPDITPLRSDRPPFRGPAIDHQIRRSGRTVQDCPVMAACWADVPGLSSRVGIWLWPLAVVLAAVESHPGQEIGLLRCELLVRQEALIT